MTTVDADTPLPDDLESAHRLIRELLATLRQQAHLNAHLQHQLEQLLRRLYGRRSEKLDPDQLLLFAREVAEAGGPETAPRPAPAEEPPAKPRPGGHGRKPLPVSLPRQRVTHEGSPEERLCPGCGAERRRIGEEVRGQLEYVSTSPVVL
jgi:transposase